MNKDYIVKLGNMIQMSVILNEDQKDDLISRLPTFDYDQLTILESVFSQERQDKDDMMILRLGEDPKLAASYADKLSRLTKSTYSKWEKYSSNRASDRILNKLEQS